MTSKSSWQNEQWIIQLFNFQNENYLIKNIKNNNDIDNNNLIYIYICMHVYKLAYSNSLHKLALKK